MQEVNGIFLDNHQIFGAVGQDFDAIFQEDAGIFDTDTELAGQINAGFCGSHAVKRHTLGVAGIGAGRFVDLQAQAVAVAVPKYSP